jgi:outer membrane protein assembly factor BamB
MTAHLHIDRLARTVPTTHPLTWIRRPILAATLAGVWMLTAAEDTHAVLTRLTPLRAVLNGEEFISTANVEKVDPATPRVVLKVIEDLKGKLPFRRLSVPLTADSFGQREQHSAKLLKRLAPDLTLLLFGQKTNKRYTVFGYTNGTWFQVLGKVTEDPATVEWRFTHCEPYLRRTFKGSTADLRQIIIDVLSGKKAPPEPDEKEPPGLGPEVQPPAERERKPPDERRSAQHEFGTVRGPLLAVIPTFVLIGPLALLAALFPMVFAGLALWLRRWLAFFTVVSVGSTLYLMRSWFGSYLPSAWNRPIVVWIAVAFIAVTGVFWSWRRHRGRSSEMIALGALALAAIGLAAAAWPRANTSNWRVLWTFQPAEHGVIISSPIVTNDRVYVAVIRSAGLSSAGALYCLNRATGKVIWCFDNDGEMQQVFSTPCLADGRLFFGEGLHENQASRFYCVDAKTGKRLWQYETASHTESGPCVADGKVFTGAGDDGVYCFDAATGRVVWHFQEPYHVDASPAVIGKRLYVGSGVSRTQKATRILCLDTDTGKAVWQTPTSLPAWGSPVVAGDQVFVGLGNGRLDRSAAAPAGAMLCLDANTGDELWRYPTGDAVLVRPVVDEQHVYFAARDRNAYCLDRSNGRRAWSRQLRSAIIASPTVRDGSMYIATTDGQLSRLGMENGELTATFDLGDFSGMTPRIYSTPTIAADPLSQSAQLVFVGAALDDGLSTSAALYCIEAP